MAIDLFRPYRIGTLELRNRFVRSPVGDTLADDSGDVTEDSLSFYKKLAEGGVGLIEAGHASVSPHGRIAPRGAHRIESDDRIPGLRRMVQVAHEGDAKIGLQLGHCGGSSDNLMYTGTTLAVSSTPLLNRFCPSAKLGQPHRVMTGEEIEAIIDAFVSAAKRAVEAGFDAVHLSCDERYLFGQFLSPLFNLRTDKWGGNAENRRRFGLEVVRRIRKAIGSDFPLMLKAEFKEERKGGFSLDEGLAMARQMVANGINAIEVSGGWHAVEPRQTNPFAGWGMGMGKPERAYVRAHAAALKRVVDVPVMLIGGIRSLQMAQSIVDSGDADLISMGRPFIREPDLIARWQRGDRRPATCISCDRCMGLTATGHKTECGEEARLRDQSGI